MIDDLHIDLIQMMENAGTRLAELAIQRFAPRSVLILAGPGGNGGGGLVTARHLSNRGVQVRVTLSQPGQQMKPVPAHQLDILSRMHLPVSDVPVPADLVIDALLGYSLRGHPRGRIGELIEWANQMDVPVLALDIPSGLDATSGHAAVPTIQADATLTLALPKVGLLTAPTYVGRLYLADISVPPSVYERLGITVPVLFRESTVIELSG